MRVHALATRLGLGCVGACVRLRVRVREHSCERGSTTCCVFAHFLCPRCGGNGLSRASERACRREVFHWFTAFHAGTLTQRIVSVTFLAEMQRAYEKTEEEQGIVSHHSVVHGLRRDSVRRGRGGLGRSGDVDFLLHCVVCPRIGARLAQGLPLTAEGDEVWARAAACMAFAVSEAFCLSQQALPGRR